MAKAEARSGLVRLIQRGARPRRRSAILRIASGAWIVAAGVCLTSDVNAGRHDTGSMTLSVGGSLSQSANYRRNKTTAYEWDGQELRETHSEKDEHYNDMDGTLSLSGGYFFWKHIELGLSGSGMMTWYSGTNRDDFGVYDAKLYAKRYLDNSSSYTPYLKVEGGASWLQTGDYNETDSVVSGVAGIEFLGMGSITWYAEFCSEYKQLRGSIKGTEWQNRIYLGITWYPDFGKKPATAAGGTVSGGPSSPAADALRSLDPQLRREVEAADKRWGEALQKLDRRSDSGGQPSPAADALRSLDPELRRG